MITVNQMINALEEFRAKHGGEAPVVQIDSSQMHHFVEIDFIGGSTLAVEDNGYFDMEDPDNPQPSARPVFVVNEG